MAVINLKIYSKLQRLYFKYRSLSLEEYKKSLFYHLHDSLSCVYGEYYPVDIINLGIDKQYNSLISKRKRYKKRLLNMIYKFGHLYLVSLTFSDDVLDSTSFDTRKKYVLRWCKSYTLDYFGCVDFGKKNSREHYHVICSLDTPITYFNARSRVFCSFDGLTLWRYGFASCRPIKMAYSDMYRSLDYAFKSALYSFKSSNSIYKPFFARCVDYSSKYWYSHFIESSFVGSSALQAHSESVLYMPVAYIEDVTASSQHERPL